MSPGDFNKYSNKGCSGKYDSTYSTYAAAENACKVDRRAPSPKCVYVYNEDCQRTNGYRLCGKSTKLINFDENKQRTTSCVYGSEYFHYINYNHSIYYNHHNYNKI